eukprot:SAG22_NODE_219_length_14877_cov_14.334619_5_plen_175_part_00
MNLPYVIDGDLVVAQTNACFAHLGRVLGLYGSSYAETIAVEQNLCQAMDLRNDAIGKFYGGFGDGGVAAHMSGAVDTHYGKFELVLTQNGKPFLVADTPTACDFHVFEMIDQHELLASSSSLPSPLAKYPKLTKYYADFKALPTLAGYFSGELNKLPPNNKMAAWGAKSDGGTY